MIPNAAKEVIKSELTNVIIGLEESVITLQESLVSTKDDRSKDRVKTYLDIIDKQKALYYELEEMLMQDREKEDVSRQVALIMQLSYFVRDDAALLALEIAAGKPVEIPKNLLN